MEHINQSKMILIEELKSKLLLRRTIRERFMLPMSYYDAPIYLLVAYQAEVERRFRKFESNDEFIKQFNQISHYLTDGSNKYGMIFSGLCGNGKTSWAKAIQSLVAAMNIKNPYGTSFYGMPLLNAKDLVMRSKGEYSDWRNFIHTPLLIVDDLGVEPREIMDYGNVFTPIIDLITVRYDEQLYTIFTTNLTPTQIEEKYGKRVVDRLNEMVENVIFENGTYRR